MRTQMIEQLIKKYKQELELCKFQLQVHLSRENASIDSCDEIIDKISNYEQKLSTIRCNSNFITKEEIAESKTWGQ